MEKVLLIDHHDSFIHNIIAWLSPNLQVDVLGFDDFRVLSNEEFNVLFEQKKYIGIILSPGPKSPQDYLESLQLESRYFGPIFGICLGFQMMLVNRGFKLIPYEPPFHGKTSLISTEHSLFKSLPNSIRVARYHSLAFMDTQNNSQIISRDESTQIPMVFYDKLNKRLGFQFHPESFLTEYGDELSQLVAKWFKDKHRE